jgi:hypothetical protein
VITVVHVRALISISHSAPTNALMLKLCLSHALCHKSDTVRSVCLSASRFKHVGFMIK